MPREDKGLKQGAIIPDFTLQGTDGNVYSKEQLKGKPFLLYFLRGTF